MIACYAWTDSLLAMYSADQMLMELMDGTHFSTVLLDGTQGGDFFYHNLIVSPSHGPAGTRILNLCRCLQLRVIRVCVRSSTRRACISHAPSTHIAHSPLLAAIL